MGFREGLLDFVGVEERWFAKKKRKEKLSETSVT